MGFEPGGLTSSGDWSPLPRGYFNRAPFSTSRFGWQPASRGSHSQHGTGHAQLGAAFCPPCYPSADLISSQGHEQWLEGRGQKHESLRWGKVEQAGLRCWLDIGTLTRTQVPGVHRKHTGAEAAADLSPGQVGLGQDLHSRELRRSPCCPPKTPSRYHPVLLLQIPL